MTHRPLDEPLRPVRPHPTTAAAPGTVRRARPGRPRRPRRPAAPARLAAARRSRRTLRPLDPARRPGGGGTSLLVPESRAFPDSDDLLGEALIALARSGAPSAREVLRRPRRAQRRDPLVARRADRTGRRRALDRRGTAARRRPRRCCSPRALATRARAGYYGARHRRGRRRAPGERPRRPRGRRPPAHRLRARRRRAGRSPYACYQALYAAREAIDYQRATGGMDAFDARRRGGRQP